MKTRTKIEKYTNIEYAKSAKKHNVKRAVILMAEGFYIVACVADAVKLIAQGYEKI